MAILDRLTMGRQKWEVWVGRKGDLSWGSRALGNLVE